MHLQRVAPVFNDIGIHETRNNALSDQRFGQSLRQFTCQVRDILRLATHAWSAMLTGFVLPHYRSLKIKTGANFAPVSYWDNQFYWSVFV
jgi:hypothetical protein